jgi:ABC-type sulfate/molybdate transport systems ATPase subunit
MSTTLQKDGAMSRDEVPQASDSNTERFSIDIERKMTIEAHLKNSTVQNFVWKDIGVTVKDRATKEPIRIVDNVSGFVKAGLYCQFSILICILTIAGEICAIMGPSGCGKTTLLNVLARREVAPGAEIEGVSLVNGTEPSLNTFRKISSYVEQDDALIGSLTVRETMNFAARLSAVQ